MKRQATQLQGVKFVLVGGASALVYFSIALFLDRIFGLMPVLSSAFAFVLSAVFSFIGHKVYTFKSTGNSRHEAPRFVVSALIGFALASFTPYVLSAYPSVYSYLAVLVIIPTTSFILLKCFVFPEY